MRELKKLWKKDKRFYLIVIAVLSLYTLIFFGRVGTESVRELEETGQLIMDSCHDIMENPEKYTINEKFDLEDFYRKYTIEVNHERLICIEDFGTRSFHSEFNYHYLQQMIIILFILQTARFALYD